MTWTELHPAGVAPTPRRHQRATYDPLGRRMILTGGADRGEDTWQLRLEGDAVWQRIAAPAEAPETRWVHSMNYDEANRRMLVFGGLGYLRPIFNDLWSLELSESPRWSMVSACGPPGMYWENAAAFIDDSDDRLLLLGDFSYIEPGHENDAWVSDMRGTPKWSVVSVDSSPFRSTYGVSAVHDTRDGRLIALRGMEGFSTLTSLEAWALPFGGRGGTTRDEPLPREAAAHGFPSEWSRMAPLGDPPAGRVRQMTVYDPVNERVLIHGGRGSRNEDLGDMWELSLKRRPRWTRLAPEGEPPAGYFSHGAVFDRARHRILVIGSPDVWEVSTDPQPRWTRLEPQGVAPALWGASVIMDRGRDRVLLMGWNTSDDTIELWQLALLPSLSWRRLEPEGIGPTDLVGSTALAIDERRDRLVMFRTRNGEMHELRFQTPTVAGHPAVEEPPFAGSAAERLRFDARGAPGVIAADIHTAGAGPVSLEVFDVVGRRVATQTLSAPRTGTVLWRSGELASGVYLVRVRQGHGTTFGRVIVK